MLKFSKMNGAGNDFIVLDNRHGALTLDAQFIARLCDRHRGVGADGLLLVEPAMGNADFRMRYYNRDGGEAEMCGNGARCFGRFARQFLPDRDTLTFETMAGPISAQFVDDLVRIGMGEPKDLELREMLELNGRTYEVHSVNTGVPHAVLFVDDIDSVDLPLLGAGIRYHERFSPKGTNVNLVQIKGPQRIAIRTYERGVEGETLACGTGVVACALVHHELHAETVPISVLVKGGDTLEVDFDILAGAYANVTLTGPADFVFEGMIDLSEIK